MDSPKVALVSLNLSFSLTCTDDRFGWLSNTSVNINNAPSYRYGDESVMPGWSWVPPTSMTTINFIKIIDYTFLSIFFWEIIDIVQCMADGCVTYHLWLV